MQPSDAHTMQNGEQTTSTLQHSAKEQDVTKSVLHSSATGRFTFGIYYK